jgi:murein L,D-transpeptidase YcbB/YkuD
MLLAGLQACSTNNSKAEAPPATQPVVKTPSILVPYPSHTTINWHSSNQQHEAAEQLLRLLRVLAHSKRIPEADQLWQSWPDQRSVEQREQHLFQSLALAVAVYDQISSQPYAKRHQLSLDERPSLSTERHQQLHQLATDGALALLVDNLSLHQDLIMVDASFDRLLPFTHMPWPALNDIGPLYVDNFHPQLEQIKQRLISLGDLWAGTNDIAFEDAIRQFQRRHGLKVDGAIGSQTRFWLNQSPEQRIQLLADNWLRRWVQVRPEDSSRRIEVNIPGFEMTYWQDGKATLNSRVIVGKLSRPTPLMQARITSLKVNPNWNVPVKIMWEDLLPKQKAENDFLQRRGILIKTQWLNGSDVDPQSIDWDNMQVKQFPYRLVQPPGNSNALGMVKFNMPNRNNIFLHHTGQPWLFERHHRTFSSGCVRVEKAVTLAETMLYGQNKAQQGWFMARESGETEFIHLAEPVEVYLTYRTAWVDKEGDRQFRYDMYGWNLPLTAAKSNKTVSYYSK